MFRKLSILWRRSGLLPRVLLFVFGSILLTYLVYEQRPQDEEVYAGSNLQVFLLVNFLIAALCILAFLVGRNVVKLVFDRKRNILGSKLRLRLVGAFVGLTLVPTTILFVLASGLVSNALEGWFSTQIESSVEGSIELAKQHYALLETTATERTDQFTDQFGERGISGEKLHKFLEDFRSKYELSSVRVFRRNGEPVAAALSATAELAEFREPPITAEAIRDRSQTFPRTEAEGQGANRFFRGYRLISLGKESGIAVVTARIPPEVSHALSVVTDSFREYEQLKLFKNQVRTGNLLALLLITVFLLFSALWFGFYLAREITVPIQRLAEGTQAVARGNYDIQVRASGDDEIGFLVRSFNKMIADLKTSRQESDRRRSYIETILENLAVSVVGLDAQGKVTSINAAAVDLLGVEPGEGLYGRHLNQVLTGDAWGEVHRVLAAIAEEAPEVGRNRVAEFELNINVRGRELKLVFTAGRIIDESGAVLGTILLFDDVTELAKAQQMTAWREVARRIAHEIKNPLTPIQLSAQRLERQVKDPTLAPLVQECVQSIVVNVDSIKRLADEFSKFARMPSAELRSEDLNQLLSETVAPYAESNSDITFTFSPDSQLPRVLLDKEQIRRVIINLVENAVAALREWSPKNAETSGSVQGKLVTLRSNFEPRRGIASFEVIDNGPGIPVADRTRIFDPYFSTKRAGTGLGLAIVNSIVADHHGVVRMFEALPHGARFLIELPVAPRPVTNRRFGGER